MSNQSITEVFGAQVIDPSQELNIQKSLFIQHKKVIDIAVSSAYQANQRIDATGLIVCPGFIDLNATCREPGFEQIATIKSETTAAIRQGVTTLVCYPNLRPVIDNTAAAELIINRARQANLGRVLPIGALTKKLMGQELAEMSALKEAGCVAVSNATSPVSNNQTLLNAFNYAKSIDIPVILDLADSHNAQGVVDESPFSAQTGIKSSTREWELINLSRYIYLINKAKVKAHFSNLSCAESIQLIEQAKQGNPNISADTSIMHLSFTHEQIKSFDPNFNIMPPLRSEQDRQALIQGLISGVIDTVTSSHRPWLSEHKMLPFAQSKVGASTIDSFVGIMFELAEKNQLSDSTTINVLTHRAASCLNLKYGTLKKGASADFCIIDPKQKYQLTASSLLSAGKNSAFIGMTHRTKVVKTFKAGTLVYEHPNN